MGTHAPKHGDWEGFDRLLAYRLDDRKVAALPLTSINRDSQGKREEEPITASEILRALHDEKAFELGDYESSIGSFGVKTNGEEQRVGGANFNLQILHELLSLRKEGIEPFSAFWYWFDSDSGGPPPMDWHHFFVVYRDKIVREAVSFTDSDGFGFDPSVFVREDMPYVEGYDFHSSSDRQLPVARGRFWRRKFHTETYTGQMAALRDDRPDLWAYWNKPEPLAEATLRQLHVLRRLAWVIIGALTLVLIRLWW